MANPWDTDPDYVPEKNTSASVGDVPAYKTRTGAAATGVGDALGQAGGFANDLVRVLANGMTLGGADNLAAADPLSLGTQSSVGEQQAMSADAEGRLGPVLSTGANLVGAGMTSALIPGAAFSTLGRAAATTGAMGGVSTIGQSYFDDGTIPSLPEIAVGTIVGAGLGAAGQKVGAAFAKPKVNPIMDKYAGILTNEGVDVTAGQVAGKTGHAMRAREAAATGAPEFIEKQADAFSTAALKKANIIVPDGSGRLEPQLLDQGFKDIGGKMDILATHNPISSKPILTGLYRDLYTTAKTYAESVEGPAAKIIKNTVIKIGKAAKAGHLSGEDYQAITSSLEGAARGNARLAPTVRELRGTIDDAMEQALATSNPAAQGAWKEARRLYSNLLVIQRAAGTAGNDAAAGLITPAALASATKAIKGTKAYTRGWTDFDDLSRAGVALLRPLPVATHASSNEIAKALAKKLGMAAAGSALGSGFGPMGMAAGAGIGYGADMAAGAAANAMRLRPYSKLSDVSGQIGGRIGGALAAGTGNPFAKATEGM